MDLCFCCLVVQVGSGYSHKELFELNMRLKSYWKDFHESNPPAWLQLPAGNKVGDENSKIISCNLSDFVPSYRCGEINQLCKLADLLLILHCCTSLSYLLLCM